MEQNNFTAFQIVLLLTGTGLGVGVAMFTIKAFVNSIVRPSIFNDDGTTKFVLRPECEKSTDMYRKKVCNELQDIRKTQTALVDQLSNVGKTLAAMKGYYKGQGVNFE